MIPYTSDTPYEEVRNLPSEDVRKQAAAIIDRILIEAGAQPYGDLPKACGPRTEGCTIQCALNTLRDHRDDVPGHDGIYGPISYLNRAGTITYREAVVLERAAAHFDAGRYEDLAWHGK